MADKKLFKVTVEFNLTDDRVRELAQVFNFSSETPMPRLRELVIGELKGRCQDFIDVYMRDEGGEGEYYLSDKRVRLLAQIYGYTQSFIMNTPIQRLREIVVDEIKQRCLEAAEPIIDDVYESHAYCDHATTIDALRKCAREKREK